MSSYGAFSGVYDLLMDDVDYPAWAEYYLELIRRSGVDPCSVCDCACGTGSLTVQFAKRGLKVVGVDRSAEMLEIASEKARKVGTQILFVRQDMSKLTLPKPVDAIICGCDGVNYLTTPSRLADFFQRARQSLRVGGVLTFDISSPYKLKYVLGNNDFTEIRDNVAYIWYNRYVDEHETLEMELTFFQKEPNGLYRRFDENHVQKAHAPELLKRMLEQNGFSSVGVYGDRNFSAPDENALRIHFSAVRM